MTLSIKSCTRDLHLVATEEDIDDDDVPSSSSTTYVDDNLSELNALFSSAVDAAVIKDVFVQNQCDMHKSVQQFISITGLHNELKSTPPSLVSSSSSAPASSSSSAPSSSSASPSDTRRTVVVVEIKGDLFSAPPPSALCHCISVDVRMGKGIAVEFKKRFGQVAVITAQRKAIGECAVIYSAVARRYVYYLITKEKYYQKPTYDALKKSLIQMKAHAEEHDVKTICMPRIGCGLDGLLWSKVLSTH